MSIDFSLELIPESVPNHVRSLHILKHSVKLVQCSRISIPGDQQTQMRFKRLIFTAVTPLRSALSPEL